MQILKRHMQEKTADGILRVGAVDGRRNPSDLGLQSLQNERDTLRVRRLEWHEQPWKCNDGDDAFACMRDGSVTRRDNSSILRGGWVGGSG